MEMTFVLEFVLTLAVTLITSFLIPFLKEKYGCEKITNAYEIIKILVKSAEQMITKTGAGKEKKELVISRLKEYNISIDESKVDEMIESAVLEINNKIEE